MHKIFIGGYTDSAHSTILDGFNGIIGGKTRKDTAAQFHISDGFLRHSHEINVRAESFRISNKCFCLLATYVQNLSEFVINVFLLACNLRAESFRICNKCFFLLIFFLHRRLLE